MQYLRTFKFKSVALKHSLSQHKAISKHPNKSNTRIFMNNSTPSLMHNSSAQETLNVTLTSSVKVLYWSLRNRFLKKSVCVSFLYFISRSFKRPKENYAVSEGIFYLCISACCIPNRSVVLKCQ